MPVLIIIIITYQWNTMHVQVQTTEPSGNPTTAKFTKHKLRAKIMLHPRINSQISQQAVQIPGKASQRDSWNGSRKEMTNKCTAMHPREKKFCTVPGKRSGAGRLLRTHPNRSANQPPDHQPHRQFWIFSEQHRYVMKQAGYSALPTESPLPAANEAGFRDGTSLDL